jgi:hypothetical protein
LKTLKSDIKELLIKVIKLEAKDEKWKN